VARREFAKLAILIATLVPFSCRQSPDRVIFQAKVSNLRQTNTLAKNKRPDDMVEVVVPGRLFTPPVAVKTVQRSEADQGTPEHAIASIISANMAGDVSWIVENFVPAEHEQAGKQFFDPKAAGRISLYYRGIGTIEMTGEAEVRGFTVVFLRAVDEDGEPNYLTVTLSKTPSGWKQTDALAGDDTFEVMATAVRTGGIR
jgi:hypothetical protein